jgi:hypothetical protein
VPKYLITKSRYINGSYVDASPEHPATIEVPADQKVDFAMHPVDDEARKHKALWTEKLRTQSHQAEARRIEAERAEVEGKLKTHYAALPSVMPTAADVLKSEGLKPTSPEGDAKGGKVKRASDKDTI